MKNQPADGRRFRSTANISKLGFSGFLKVCTFNQNYNGRIGGWHGNPSLLILANRCTQHTEPNCKPFKS
jgi:hypothetical protein